MSFLATSRSLLVGATIAITSIVTMTSSSVAEPVIKLEVDDAKLVQIGGKPSAVVVSNPMFADASVQGDKLVLIGKNTGRTKIIVLDFDGNQLANMTVNVQRAEDQVVSLYKGGERTSLNCDPFCDRNLVVNDEPVSFENHQKQISGKTAISNGAVTTGGGAAGN
ncbi:MAG: pilus assembly protein N-terminal domain-containing protein [Anderseniella sp.]